MAQIVLLLQLALSLLNTQPSTTTIAMAMQAVNIAEQALQNQSSAPVVVQPAPIVATTTTTMQSISVNATTTCPDGKPNIVDGPPDPCNPYAFKLSNCPPPPTKPLVGGVGSSPGVPGADVLAQWELIQEYCPGY